MVGVHQLVTVVELAPLDEVLKCCMCTVQANTSGYQVVFYGAGLYSATHAVCHKLLLIVERLYCK